MTRRWRAPPTAAVLAAFALLMVAVVAAAGARPVSVLAGRVVGVADGDTLTVLVGGREQVRVRLAWIDAPEAGQPYGSRARQELSALAFGEDVAVRVVDTDRYGRSVGEVTSRGRDAGSEMVRRGAAWVYRRYSSDVGLLALEAEARAARRGLWGLPEAERAPPWEWRASGREGGGGGR